ncbi:MAG TPA: hypothetical protein VF618_27005 [Thermoanaerobaculia bacterium]
MASSDFSPELEQFVRDRLASIDQIEIVMLLASDPSRAWTAPQIAQQLGTAPEPAAMRLFLLASNGLLALDPTGVPKYRFQPMDAATGALVTQLTALYPDRKDAVADIISGSSRDPVRSFADAFKLKK